MLLMENISIFNHHRYIAKFLQLNYLMKNFILTAAFLFAASAISYGQNPVNDTHPGAAIYIYDPQSGQEVLAESDAAIMFKDALIDLVTNTSQARMIMNTSPGHKSIVITQAAPTQGNAYQMEMDTKVFGQTSTLYTYSYNVDQNTLYYYDQNSQSWMPQLVQGNNVVNMNSCLALGKFNDPQTWNTQASDGTTDEPVQASTPPPALQDEVQPDCPVDGYLWQPGYWAFSRYNGGYYWVPGTWVAPPTPGYLWTPPYWGFEGGIYGFHSGYWGVTVGFYGGINYGYGYGGHGFYGGEWYGGHFRYNTAVVHVNTTVVHNTYFDRTVINNTTVNNKKVSFNGPGGADAKPRPEELAAANQKHIMGNAQDPKAPKTAVRPAATGQKGNVPAGNFAKTPANGQKTPGNGTAPKVPGNAPGVPKVPGNGPGAPRVNGQRQPMQGQMGGQKGGKQPAKTQAPPPSKDKKNP
jgi:hypothetical protein